MSKISKKTAVILTVLICLVAVYGAKFGIGYFRKNTPKASAGKVKGAENAPIKVTEFIDFQCPACARGAAYLKEKIQQYPAAIRLELKHYPLAMHQHGFLSSQYAECAASQGKFWSYHDLLLARQSNWKRLVDAQPAFERIADEVHLDKAELQVCLQNEATDAIIEKNRAEGKKLGVRSTPTYFVNGKMIVGKKSLDEEIVKLLKKNGY